METKVIKAASCGKTTALASMAATDYGVVEERIVAHMTEVPDRVSIDARSPYYWPHYKRLGVMIDDMDRPGDVHEFCVSEGWAMTRVRNEKGQFKIDPEGSGFLLERTAGRIFPYLREDLPDERVTVGDAERIRAAQEKRERKAAKLRKQMGDRRGL